ncbi:MAG TPA: hypothetical protein VGK19_24240 [Capsulimonadaceae bacterium]
MTPVRIATTVTLVVLAALLVVPSTRRQAVNAPAALLLDGIRVNPRLLSPSPASPAEQVAAVVFSEDKQWGLTEASRDPLPGLARLHELEKRFPNEPIVYANALRFALLGPVSFRRADTCRLYSSPCSFKAQIPDPALTKLMIADAETGRRLEPDNAYFAIMASYAYYAANRDTEGLAAFEAAGRCQDWDEHAADVLRARIKLLPWYRRTDPTAILQVKRGLDLLNRDYRILSSAAIVIVKAAHLEQSGNIAEGARLRRLVRHIGETIEAKSHSAAETRVGDSFVDQANFAPGGQPVSVMPGVDREAFQALQATNAAVYFRSHGYVDDAVDVMRTFRQHNVAAVDIDQTVSDALMPHIMASLKYTSLMCCLLGFPIWTAFLALFVCAIQPNLSRATDLKSTYRTVGLVVLWCLAPLPVGLLSPTVDSRHLITHALIGGWDSPGALLALFAAAFCAFYALASPKVCAIISQLRVVLYTLWFAIPTALLAATWTTEYRQLGLAETGILIGIAAWTRLDWGKFCKAAATLAALTAAFLGIIISKTFTITALLIPMLRSIVIDTVSASRGHFPGLIVNGDHGSSVSQYSDFIVLGCLFLVLIAICIVDGLTKSRRQKGIATRDMSYRVTLPWFVCAIALAFGCMTILAAKTNDKLYAQVMQRVVDEPGAMAREVGRTWPGR